jgi:hypothetical protein
MMYELQTKYDGRKSFYSKAIVKQVDNVAWLYSYGNKICEVRVTQLDDIEVKIFNQRGTDLTFSHTSLRHLKEYLKQSGLEATSKAQIMRDYTIVEVDNYERI